MKNIFSKKYFPLLLISPTLIFYIVFWMAPTLNAIKATFTDVDGNLSTNNFRLLLEDKLFTTAVFNTFVFVGISIIIQFILAIFLSVILNKKFNFSKSVLFVLLIPMALPPTAMAIMWKLGLAEFGWINSLLMQFHLINAPIKFLEARGIYALILLVIVDTWTVLPSIVIIILAGLQNLNKEFEEAGTLFGANKLRVIIDIVIPILRPSIVTAMILRVIAGMQIWMLSVMIFGYNTVPFLVERIAYRIEMIPGAKGSMEYAYAMSTFVAVIIGAMAYVYISYNNKQMQKGGR